MKYFVVFALVILAACNIRAEITKQEATKLLTACQEETGASDAEFETIIKHSPAKTKEGKCMRACAFKKLGVMNDKGKMITGAAIELAKSLVKDDDKKEAAAGIVKSCDGLKVSDDHCEAAEEYTTCVKSKLDSNGITSLEDLI